MVFQLQVCSVVFITLNKHMRLDELVLLSSMALWEIVAGGPPLNNH